MAGLRSPRRGSTNTRRGYSRVHTERSKRQRGSTLKRVLFTILVLAVLGVAVTFLVFRGSGNITIYENAIGTIFTPIENALHSSAKWAKDFFTNWRSYDKLQNENDILHMENEQLSLQLQGMDEIELENERLSALLDASGSYESLDPLYADVIARDPGQWFDTFTIDRGTSEGVTAGMAVVTGSGLVGYVYEAGLAYAKVMTIIDTRSAVAVLVQRTRDNGVMRGEVTAVSEDAEGYVYYLPNVNNIVPGDVIVTSGTDSLYPKGLTIGEVIAVSQETSADGSYVIVSPYVDFRHIEEVLVLRTVIGTDESLPVVATPTPAPYTTSKATAAPTNADGSTLSPEASDTTWHYPTMQPSGDETPTPAPTQIELLPEDIWAQ